MSYNGADKIADIEAHGWTEVPFLLSEADRARFAGLANMAISIACEDEAVREALGYTLAAPPEAQKRAGTYGLKSPVSSWDDKLVLHLGYQSRERATAQLGLEQPQVIQDLWDASEAVLDEVGKATKSTLHKLGAEALTGNILPTTTQRRNIHLRVTRYVGATAQLVGTETPHGHTDLGLATLHLFETHGGWIHSAPYPVELMTAQDSAERRSEVQAMRSNLQPMVTHPHAVPFLIGAAWHGSSLVPEELRDLPAAYHAGFVPEPSRVAESPHLRKVTYDNDRVSVVAFLLPNTVALAKGSFTPPPVEYCRPSYE